MWQVLHQYQPLLGCSLLLLLLPLCLRLLLLGLLLLRLLLSALLRLQVCSQWLLLLLLERLLLFRCLWAAEWQGCKLAACHKHVKVVQLTAVAHTRTSLDTTATAEGKQQCGWCLTHVM
jgi:hypothetical protein